MNYTMIQQANLQRREEEKWYASPVNEGKITKTEITKEIVNMSSLSRGDVSNVIENLIIKRLFTKKAILILFVLVFTHSLFAAKYFVHPTGSSSNDGLSWATAKAGIGTALALAGNGDTVFVAVGIYTGTVIVEAVNSGVSIYGGFSGFETELNQRPTMNYGVNEYGQSSLIIGVNGGWGGTDAAVYMNKTYTNPVTFDGFSVQAAAAGQSSNSGGIVCGSNTRINNCAVTMASQHGISVFHNSIPVTNCRVENCMIKNNGNRSSSGSNGGGIYIYSATVTVTDCVIDGNSGSMGGAVYAVSSNATFIDCSIINNEGYYTGGIDNASTLRLTNCFIVNNRAWHSVNTGSCVGGIWSSGITSINGCIVANNTATNTHASGYYTAGGIFFSGTSTGKEIVNSSIVNNLAETNYTASIAGGVVCSNTTYLTDCLVWGNKKNAQFSQFYGTSGATIYSAIQGENQTGTGNINLSADNTGSDSGVFYPFFDTPSPFAGSGTTPEENLQIMQADWKITQGSACINTGIPVATGLNLLETDIYGTPRICSERIDIGAAEYLPNSQTITWDQSLHFSLSENSVLLTATATSGLPVTYTSSNTGVASISGNMLILHSAGTATIYANQEGNEFYNPAPEVSKPLSIINFIPVTNITGVPATATAGVPLTLTGTVEPSNATNQTIVWSIEYADTTGATVIGNVFEAASASAVPVIVKATIADGAAIGTDYTQDFEITVITAFVPVTGITDVPAEATAGTPLTLTGTVEPSNATNKNITWSITDAGSTGATLVETQGITSLHTTAAGTATITATIANGTAAGTDFVKNFSITVNPPVGIVETDNYPSLRVYPNPTVVN